MPTPDNNGPPLTRKPLSVATSVTIAIVVGVTLVLAFLSLLGYGMDRSDRLAALQVKTAVVADQLSTAMVLPVWNFDRPQIDKVIESAMKDADVFAVSVRLTDKMRTQHLRIRDEKWNIVEPADKDFSASELLAQERSIVAGEDSIGSVKVFLSPKFVEARIRQNLYRNIAAVLFVDWVLILALRLLMSRVVLQPLRALDQYAVGVSEGDGTHTSPIRARFRGELERTRASIEKMVVLLDQRFKEMQTSELKYRTLADNTLDMIYQLTVDGVVTYMSPQISRYGFALEDFMGAKVGKYCHPEDRENQIRAFREMVTEDKPALVQYRVVTKTGDVIWMEANARAVRDDSGNIIGATGVLRDINERKRAEEALRQSEEHYRLLFRNNPMSMWVYDLDSLTFLAVNAAAIREYGYSEAEFLAMTVWEIVPTEGVAPLEQFLSTVQSTGNCFSQRLLRKKNGDVINVEINSDQLSFNGKRARLVLASDVTDRVRAEEALRLSDERYQLAVSGSTAGLWDWNTVTHQTYYAPRFKELLGYADAEFPNVIESFFNSLHPDDLSQVHERVILHFRDRKPFDVEYRLRTRPGEYRWFNARGQALWDAAGKPYRMAGSIVDITERKLTERELQVSRAQLQLLSRQLLAAQETERRHIARELHDEIGQVLTAISINLHAVKGVIAPTALVGQVARIEDGIAIVDQAIQQVRNMSLDLRPTILDDFGLFAAARWYLERQSSRADMPMHFDSQLHDARLPTELESATFRVIQEAVTNIVRHARAKEVWVLLRQNDGKLELDIRDDGVGFDVEKARRRAAAGGSTGLLGMQERVELLGGQFTIASTPGHGTVIQARLEIGEIPGDAP